MASATRRGQPTARSLHTHTHTQHTHSLTRPTAGLSACSSPSFGRKSKRRDKTAVQQDTNTAVEQKAPSEQTASRGVRAKTKSEEVAGPLVFSEIGKSAVRPLFTTPTLGSLLEDEEAVLVAECHRAATVAARLLTLTLTLTSYNPFSSSFSSPSSPLPYASASSVHESA